MEEYLQTYRFGLCFYSHNVEHRGRRGWNYRIGVSTATELVQTKKAEQKMFSFSVGVAGRLQTTTNTFISTNYVCALKIHSPFYSPGFVTVLITNILFFYK